MIKMKPELKNGKNTRIKTIIIIILTLIFVLVAYFRFFHNKSIRATDNIIAAPLAEPLKVPPAYPAGAETGKMKEAPGGGAPVSGTVTRNIFAPANTSQTSGESALSALEKVEGKTLPSFKLSGVIADEGAAIAVINGKFLKKGDSIEGYQVVRIGDKTVILSGNGQKIVLNVITNTDKQF